MTAADGEGAEAALGSRSPAGGWLSGDVVQSGAPVALAQAGDDERLRGLDPMLAGRTCGLPRRAGGRRPKETIVGVLAVYASLAREWREEEIEALLAVAASTSAALSNAELYQRVALERERSVAILANIADGIVAVDRDGKVVLWNSAAEGITGIPASVALGRAPASTCCSGASRRPTAAARGDRLVPIARGREEVWLSVTEAVMRDPLGGVAGRIFAFRDISGDRLVEQVKSDFVSTVSHELRTPLTSIYGFAETLLRQDVMFGEEERQTFLRYIASESQRLTSIVDTLLERRAARHRRPAGQSRRDGRPRRRRAGARDGLRDRGQRTRIRRRAARRAALGERGPGEAAPGLLDPRRERAPLLARRRNRDGRRRAA